MSPESQPFCCWSAAGVRVAKPTGPAMSAVFFLNSFLQPVVDRAASAIRASVLLMGLLEFINVRRGAAVFLGGFRGIQRGGAAPGVGGQGGAPPGGGRGGPEGGGPRGGGGGVGGSNSEARSWGQAAERSHELPITSARVRSPLTTSASPRSARSLSPPMTTRLAAARSSRSSGRSAAGEEANQTAATGTSGTSSARTTAARSSTPSPLAA